MSRYYEFRINVELTEPEVSRYFQLRVGSTFDELYKDVCVLLNCPRYDDFQFCDASGEYFYRMSDGEYELDEVILEGDVGAVKLRNYFVKPGDSCVLTQLRNPYSGFDSETDFSIEIELIRTFSSSENFRRRFVSGANSIPPFCPGVVDYYRALAALGRRVPGRFSDEWSDVDLVDERSALAGWTPETFDAQEMARQFDR